MEFTGFKTNYYYYYYYYYSKKHCNSSPAGAEATPPMWHNTQKIMWHNTQKAKYLFESRIVLCRHWGRRRERAGAFCVLCHITPYPQFARLRQLDVESEQIRINIYNLLVLLFLPKFSSFSTPSCCLPVGGLGSSPLLLFLFLILDTSPNL